MADDANGNGKQRLVLTRDFGISFGVLIPVLAGLVWVITALHRIEVTQVKQESFLQKIAERQEAIEKGGLVTREQMELWIQAQREINSAQPVRWASFR